MCDGYGLELDFVTDGRKCTIKICLTVQTMKMEGITVPFILGGGDLPAQKNLVKQPMKL